MGGGCIFSKKNKSAHVATYGAFIGKDYRNLGLGTILTKELIEVAKGFGFEIVQLDAFATNTRAFHVYQKCGFREIGRLTNDIKFSNGAYNDRILMELLLK